MNKIPDSQILVIFGASGDLTHRKLIPALFELFERKLLPEKFLIVGVARTRQNTEEFRKSLYESMLRDGRTHATDNPHLTSFLRCVYYIACETTESEAYGALFREIEQLRNAAGLEMTVAADRCADIYRLIFNLTENAVKYNRPGGSVRVSVTQELEKLLLRVSDTGCGIPEVYQRSIFQPFFRVDKSRSREYGGAGLGLSLVWEIADLHGGSVWVEKSSEKGTTIAVGLPTQQSTKP